MGEKRLFNDVFKDIKIEKRIKDKLNDCVVISAVASHTLPNVDVYLENKSILNPRDVSEAENAVFKQMFNKAGKKVTFHMRYTGEDAKDFDSAWRGYHMYLEDELSASRIQAGRIYRNARVSAAEGKITIELTDDSITKSKSKLITDTLESLWKDHFDIPMSIECIYHEPKESEEEGAPSEPVYEYADGSVAHADSFASAMKEDSEKEHKEDSGASGEKAHKSSNEGAKGGSKDGGFKDGFKGKGSFKGKSDAYDKARAGRKRIVSDDPTVILGYPVDEDPISISEITGPIGSVVIKGMIFKYEEIETKTGRIIATLAVTDFTDSIAVKVFLHEEEKETVPQKLKEGSFVKIKGSALIDEYSKDKEVVIQSVNGIKSIPDFRVKRKDTAPVKRVELHAHTMMSDMDGVIPADVLVKTAFKWGHRGIAITDHGVAQSFPIANHAIDWKKMPEDTDEQKAEKERAKNFKIIYGCEGYVVDDEPDVVIDEKGHRYEKGPDGKYSDEDLQKMPACHIILLCANDTGRINLYKLISISHLTYFHRVPKIPKSILKENREGIIIGSACEAGELFRAIVHNKPAEEIERVSGLYDYYEIQQIGNNMYMLEDPKFPEISSEEDLKLVNRRIAELAAEHGKPCVATCDVHFLNPEDEIYRRIIMASKGFKDADRQAPLYLHTTEEMLDECSYLGSDKAYEVVVENPNKIFDMIEKISPVRPDKAPPVIPDSDKTLREICENRAHEIYGPELPKQVHDRLEHELESIIKNGFAVMYIIAQKLVWKSNEDGYLVGSRGSVGSSFVATMSGITEINPLPPHYYCKKCHYSEFDSDVCKEYEAKSGCDMPDKYCPVCGEKLVKEGHNIPFETFLGFYGDKEPDIDLNFSGEYQSKAHDYTEVIFGAGQTFRAGTIGTLADKTAFGLVSKYCEERDIHKRSVEKERISAGCVGVRRTTGQHPGGIVVLPLGESIYSFTPVQHPANDMTTSTITTHFEYHSIDHNLLKLDILGHDDPTMIRMLEDLTGVDAKTIPMDDPKVISLFESGEALGVTPDQIDGVELGSLGLPELGTNFVMQMLKDTKPKCFSDMVKIAGLSHGTDVWLNNAQYYIANGDCTLSTAICTRDDIMIYLISMGIEPGLAFKTMESVRKGKGLQPHMEQAMLDNGVPAWYIESCKKIKYMFPKAHACAYMMMAFRIAYFKIYYPLAYYAAYFSIRAADFNYEKMCMGKQHLLECMKELREKDSKLSAKESGEYDDMRSVLEFYARGFEFMPIDIYKVKARHFQIFDGKLMPSLSSIAGLGEKAAEMIVDVSAKKTFMSREDFKNSCKVSDTITKLMNELGILSDLPESDQLSFMDMLTF